MESHEKLIQTLEAMIDAHTHLLDLVKEKRAILIEGNTLRLQELIQRESSCVGEIQKLELDRKNFVQNYLNQMGLTNPSPTLEELIKNENNPITKSTLNKISKQLRFLIKEITNINESNQQLIQTSLSYVEYSLGMLVPKVPNIGYGPKSGRRYANLLDAKV
ncbi:flagellar protein FlgN [Neobacillus niacini]|uniref:flagellar protein FlgN n=1 Tax=Neobacillus niacini TaxID=86668 RepID=UPI0028631A10|nr:flagellar protein FlgN [Neobacillus niacini]MDR7000978.1 flagellar biosynthesis/type III secretory pathway chaperone [Neobacillus niacini]